MIKRSCKVDQSEQELEQDFSKPWEHSDVILLVEGQQFHVHRAILAISSPVFSRMFAADFKEKNAEEIPLPEKKAEEMREMLLAIYPNSLKPVNKKNCYFLLALAQEYQVTKLTKRCEDFLLQAVEKQPGADVLETLIVAQSYTLERVIDECVKKTQSLSVDQIKRHEMYQKIKPLTQRKMIELQMHKVEEEVSKMKTLAAKALEDFNSVVSVLGDHIRVATAEHQPFYTTLQGFNFHVPPIKQYSSAANMQTIQQDKVGPDCPRTGACSSFISSAYSPLKNLHGRLTEMSTQKTSQARF